ncbi:heavy-metal-associated domain-containing protein [Marinifilum caeruleilacunae]|jgi:copper chaperone CopZ|uniref:Heavy-metal-associated domain-containing protein n=1 Tax=Marinifilum caeruleilacunae TaxID=2499076 RepID=A0ABX1X0I5_9BACT|nr:heavy metal-associated domain-containing protein [Marinifilum caeruleilacunae]NOU61919.1 heavy-metal-associated domain-containing protein [Marinifilum caeruleilacunae]
MNKLFKILKSTLLVLSIVLCSTLSYAGNKDAKKVETVVFKVEMDCMGCAGKIEKNIPFEKGVKKLNVDFKAQKVTITYKADKTSKENLKKALEKLKFKVEEFKA